MIMIDFQTVIDKKKKNIKLANTDIPEGTYNVHLELTSIVTQKKDTTKTRQPDFGKGLVIYMDKNFNNPIDDFRSISN